jgi:hypothetical protein
MNRLDAISWVVKRGLRKLTPRQQLLHEMRHGVQPLMVAYGMGVDSTALLVEMFNRKIRPDIILFGDTGSEKPATYAYEAVIRDWLKRVNFPDLIKVRRKRGKTKYDSLHEECLVNKTLPAISVGQKQCSIKW